MRLPIDFGGWAREGFGMRKDCSALTCEITFSPATVWFGTEARWRCMLIFEYVRLDLPVHIPRHHDPSISSHSYRLLFR